MTASFSFSIDYFFSIFNTLCKCKCSSLRSQYWMRLFCDFQTLWESLKTIRFWEKEFMEFSIKQNRVVLKSRVTESILKRAYLSVCTQDSFCHILGLASSLRMKWFEDAFFGYLRCWCLCFFCLPLFLLLFKNTVD